MTRIIYDLNDSDIRFVCHFKILFCHDLCRIAENNFFSGNNDCCLRIEQKGLHSLRHTFATNLVNGIKQEDGSIRSLTPRQVADLLGHSTSQITEMYYVKKDTTRLAGVTDGFEL